MATNDLHYKISADAQGFTKGMKEVEKATKDVNKAVQDEAKKTVEAEKLTLKQIRERGREEARLGREAEKIYESTRTAAERYQKQVAELQGHLKARRIDQDTFNRSMENLKKPTNDAGSALSGFGNSLKSLVHPAALAAAGVAALGVAAKASMEAFREQDKVNQSLSFSLKQLGSDFQNTQRMLDGISRGSLHSTKELSLAYQGILQVSGDTLTAEADLKRAMDASAASGQDLVSTSRAIAEARKGNISSIASLNLLTAKEIEMLGKVEDEGTRASLALKALETHTKGASAEVDPFKLKMAQLENGMTDLKVASGEFLTVMSAIVADIFLEDMGIESTGNALKDLALVIQEVNKDVDDLARKAKLAWLAIQLFQSPTSFVFTGGIQEAIDLFRDMDKAAEGAKNQIVDLVEGQYTAAVAVALDFSPDGLTDSEFSIQQALSKQFLEGIEKRKKAQADADRQRRAEEGKASLIRQKQLDFDLKMLNATSELERERLRLQKEEFTIKESIKNKDEQKLALQLAQEQSAQKQLEIQRKGWNEAEAAWNKEQAEARKKAESEMNELLRLRESALTSLKTPQDLLNEQLAEYDRLLSANLITLAEHTELTRKAREESEKRAEKEKEKISAEMQSLIDMSTFAGQSIMEGFSDLLFDPFNANLEDMVQNFAKGMGRMALEALAFQAINNATGGAGGTFGDLFGSLFSGAIKKADGGYISGPGTGTSDSIPAFLSNGEFVIPAKATSYYGADYLEDLRKMRVPKHRRYAEGGLVTASGNKPTSGVQAPSSGSQGNVDVTIINPRTEDEILQAIASTRGKKVILNTVLEHRKTLKL